MWHVVWLGASTVVHKLVRSHSKMLSTVWFFGKWEWLCLLDFEISQPWPLARLNLAIPSSWKYCWDWKRERRKNYKQYNLLSLFWQIKDVFGLNLLLLKIENWKHCSKIIFKRVNSIVGPIFNIFNTWTVHEQY